MTPKNKIRILDEVTINQIAAGEVIERPASVVKELVENAIDADSKRIDIIVNDGGKKYIRVMDDGEGMTQADAKLAFERYSTSKIQYITDLNRLQYLGFRGEALASIAAVSKVELITRSKLNTSGVGTKVKIEGSKLKEVVEVGSPPGTTVTVTDLFYNTPARKKYLKSVKTELAHISDIVTRHSLANVDVAFRLVHNDTEVLNAPSAKSLQDKMVYFFGVTEMRNMIPVNLDKPGISIRGIISKPEVTRANLSNMYFFVNRRPVHSKLITNAIRDAYQRLIPSNRYPIIVLMVEIDPTMIDINIHPTKREIRFAKEYDVYQNVVSAIQSAFHKHKLIPSIKIDKPARLEIQKLIPTEAKPALGPPMVPPEREGKIPLQVQTTFKVAQPAYSQEPKWLIPSRKMRVNTLPPLMPLGQLHNTYIIAECEDGMMIIDQHAAHERIRLEQLETQYRGAHVQSQELISAMVLELTPKESSILQEHLETLNTLGFDIEPFGTNTFKIRSVPVVLGKIEDKELIHDIIEELIALGHVKEVTTLKDKLIHILACKSAIRAGEKLTPEDINMLISNLYLIKDPYTCAHGRPTIVSMTTKQLEKLFKR
jgi:DNA mismatch repair protein MutL